MKLPEPEPETEPIKRCNELLSSILHEIPSIPNFKGKWSLIGAKLTHLQNQLTPNYPSNNPLHLHLLHSLSRTLNDTVSLANECHSLNPSQGKLKTQSHLDSLLATLHCHVTDSNILFHTQHTDLITRLQIGSTHSRNSALDSLLSSFHQNDKNVVVAVAQGILPVLLRLLDSPSTDIKDKTVAAISIISTVDNTKHVLLAEGLFLLNHLLRVLDSGTGFAKDNACVTLQALTHSKENAIAIGSRGGISSLLEICQAGTPSSQASAAAVLKNLAGFSEIKENFIEENAVFVLLGLASSGTASAQENAVTCLSNLVSGDESLKLLVVEGGGVECLRNFWDSGVSVEVAVEFLRCLASSEKVADVLLGYGFVPRVVEVLDCGVMAVRIAAAESVYILGLSGEKARKEMGECGCVEGLIKMLDGKGVEEREVGVKALSVVVLYGGNRRVFRKDERGVVSAVQLLNQDLDKRYPVSLLASVVRDNKCRKQMVAAGACVYLKKLVEMDVEGSKKLLESLGRGKMWGVFARPK